MKAIQLSNRYKTLLNNYGINSPLRLAMFFAQLDHESNLNPRNENFNYSRKRLLEVFPEYFSSENIDSYVGKPIAIANKVYAKRMGNGSEHSGDGFRFRGRGFIQLTGKNNYQLLSKDTRTDYLLNPDWLLNEPDAMISACWFWSKNNLNSYADVRDLKGATKVINGGYNGLKDREEKYNRYLNVFK